MHSLTIHDESIDSSGAISVFHAAVDELNRRYGGTDDDLHLRTDELTPPLGLFLVARVEGHLAGGVGVRPIAEPGDHFGEVKRLWVRPDLRRRGVAAALMAVVQERARLSGYLRLYLETGHAQPEAQAFYPRIGWTRVDQFPPGVFSYPDATRFTKVL